MTPPLRVFLCDDVSSLRQMLRFALEDDGTMEVVGEAADGEAGVEGVRRTRPDVVVLDLSMPKLDGLSAIPLLREVSPDSGIVVFSSREDDGIAEHVVERGADRFLSKGADLDDIRATVQAVAEERRAA